MTDPSEAPGEPEVDSGPSMDRRRCFRWWPALLILLFGGGAMLFAWYGMALDRTYQVFSLWILLPTTMFLLLLWWLFASGLRWQTRVVGVLVVAGFLATLRLEDYKGDMIPVLRFVWETDREARAREYFAAVSDPPSSLPGADLAPLVVTDSDWPEFRGASRDGRVTGVTLRSDWKKFPPRELWRHPVGQGWGSFAVVGRRVFTQEQRGDDEVVSCWDLETGEPVWSHRDRSRFNEAMGGLGPRATPTVSGSRVYTLGPNGLLNCLDGVTGQSQWSSPPNVLDSTRGLNLEWAMSGSPLVVDDLVIVSPGGAGGGVAAFDAETGELRWGTGDRPASYASPKLVNLGGRRILLAFGGDGLTAYQPARGEELWHIPWTNGPRVNAAMPLVVGANRLLISSGYGVGCGLLDMTAGTGDRPGFIWQSKSMKCKFNDPVIHEGHAYGLDEGILVCLDLETGRRRWKRGRYGYGQLLIVDDLIIVQAEKGSVTLVQASPEKHRELGRIRALTSKTWNHPVLVGNRLLVRNADEMACYELATE